MRARRETWLLPGLPTPITHPSGDPVEDYITEVAVNYCSLQAVTRVLHRGLGESDQLSGCICSHIDNNLHWWKRLWVYSTVQYSIGWRITLMRRSR